MPLIHIPAKNTIDTVKKALVAYLPDSYSLPPDHPNFFGHSNFQECRALIESLTQQGFTCDLIGWQDDVQPYFGKKYDLFIGVTDTLTYGKELVHEKGKVIAYATTCHWSYHNSAEYDRVNQLRTRRGIVLQPRRQLSPQSFENCIDEIWYLGSIFQIDTYRHISAPKFSINISTIAVSTKSKRITRANKKHFLWYGSAGCVHKGLDWLLEIFSKNPQLHLHVCGLVELEKDFFSAYHHELFELPNISFHGWILPHTTIFQQISEACAFVISPSCAEGGGGATLQCMAAGLIPIATKENSVDIRRTGFFISKSTIEETEKTILAASRKLKMTLQKKARLSMQFIQDNHTLAHYKKAIQSRLSAL